jgi:hypothetical protein
MSQMGQSLSVETMAGTSALPPTSDIRASTPKGREVPESEVDPKNPGA